MQMRLLALGLLAFSSGGVLAGVGDDRADAPATSGSMTTGSSSTLPTVDRGSSSTSIPSSLLPRSPVPSAAGLASSTAPSSSSNTSAPDVPPPRPSGSTFPACHVSDGPLRPFCQPTDGSDVWVGETYYVTWDATFFARNSTVRMELNYANPPPNAGQEAWHSDVVKNAWGYVTVTMDDQWRSSLARNNLTFYIVQMDPTPDARPSTWRGPTVSLIKKPASYPTPHPKPPASELALYVGLPVILVALAVMLSGLYVGLRTTRIRLGIVIGRSSRRGYGERQSHRQRMRHVRHWSERLPLGGDPPPSFAPDGFRDEPTPGIAIELADRHAPAAGGHDGGVGDTEPGRGHALPR
ncbi:MAG: hypothetical protein M1826_001420 [Phylliscum demangeonii]|nr:MAG: hypothetical protein M1826_001420 [Phylliscum demangeonii]